MNRQLSIALAAGCVLLGSSIAFLIHQPVWAAGVAALAAALFLVALIKP